MRLPRLAILCFGLLGGLALAQTPTPAQLEMLKSMPAAQREALLKQYGLDPSVLEEGDNGASSSSSQGAARSGGPSKQEIQQAAEALILQPSDTVLITVSAKAPTTTLAGVSSTAAAAGVSIEGAASESFLDAVRRGNPYVLDRSGQLALPGGALIALGGLTEQQANQRLALEPSLSNVTLSLARLPVKGAGAVGLKPFGYDLFDQESDTFAPAAEGPVPADYVMGAGDRLSVQLYGSQNRTVQVTVNRDGTMSFPELGPIPVVGKTFEAVREEIEVRVAKQMIGTRVG
jgi:protein involved in polysaccharide export with SLBB domain